jgi:hypothetical protein
MAHEHIRAINSSFTLRSASEGDARRKVREI